MFVIQVASVFSLGVFCMERKEVSGVIRAEIKEYDDEVKMQIGNRIQEARIAKGLAAVDLAAYLDVKPNQISRIETGKANCTIHQMFIISQLLDCSVDYLMFGKKNEPVCSEEQKNLIKALYKTIA